MPFTRDVEAFRERLLELQGRGEFEALLKESATALAEHEMDSPPDATTGELAFLHGNSLLLNCHYDSAETHYQYAAGVFDALGMHDRRIQCRLRIARCAMLLTDLPRAQHIVESVARDYPEPIPAALNAEIHELLGRIAWRLVDLGQAVSYLSISRESYYESGNDYMALVTANNLAAIYIEISDFPAADALLAECQAGFSKRGDHRRVWDLKATRAFLIYCQGDLETARQRLRECVKDVDQYPDPSAFNRVYYNLGIFELLSGNFTEAKKLLLRSSATPQHTKVLSEMGVVQVLLALIALLQCDYREATNLVNLAQLNLPSFNVKASMLLTAITAVLNLVADDPAAARNAWSHCLELEPDQADRFTQPLLHFTLEHFSKPDQVATKLKPEARLLLAQWLEEYKSHTPAAPSTLASQ